MLRVLDTQGARREYYPAGTRYLRQELVYFHEPIGRLQNRDGGPVFEYMARLSVRRGQQSDRKLRFLRTGEGRTPSLFMFDERAWWQLVARDRSIDEIREHKLGKVIQRGLGYAAILGSESGLSPFEVVTADIGMTGELKIQDYNTKDGVDIYARWPEFTAVSPGTAELLAKPGADIPDSEKRLS